MIKVTVKGSDKVLVRDWKEGTAYRTENYTYIPLISGKVIEISPRGNITMFDRTSLAEDYPTKPVNIEIVISSE